MARSRQDGVQTKDISAAVRRLGLVDRPLCVHASLRSFGWVERGADGVLDGLLAEGCTVLVPAFSWGAYGIPAPQHLRPARNGLDYALEDADAQDSRAGIYRTSSTAIDTYLGAIPAAVLRRPSRARGDHPVNSFAAVGPLAALLVADQRPNDVYAPLERLATAGGSVMLMGVGLESMTLLHAAERRAGRTLFRRWARVADGHAIMVEVGGCSRGFGRLEAALGPACRTATVGASDWRAFQAEAALRAAALAIRAHPTITRCDDDGCERCRDAILGGPLLVGWRP